MHSSIGMGSSTSESSDGQLLRRKFVVKSSSSGQGLQVSLLLPNSRGLVWMSLYLKREIELEAGSLPSGKATTLQTSEPWSSLVWEGIQWLFLPNRSTCS